MPIIDIQVLEGVFSVDDKKRIIRKITDALGEVAGGQMQENSSVRIHEIKRGAGAYAGEVITSEDGLRIKNAAPSSPG